MFLEGKIANARLNLLLRRSLSFAGHETFLEHSLFKDFNPIPKKV